MLDVCKLLLLRLKNVIKTYYCFKWLTWMMTNITLLFLKIMILLAPQYWLVELVLTGYNPEIGLILLIWSDTGLSLSASQQFAFWPWVALAGDLVLEHKLNMRRWGMLVVCPRGLWKGPSMKLWITSPCGDDLCPVSLFVLNPAVDLVTLCLCHSFNIANCMHCECYISNLHPKACISLALPVWACPTPLAHNHTHTQGTSSYNAFYGIGGICRWTDRL